jgi:hypothetical protein
VNDLVLRTIAAGGRPGSNVATIICDLVVKGGELGELEEYEFKDPTDADPDAKPVKRRRMPRIWLDRLARAIETGAIERLSTTRIVEILLQGQR